MARLRSAAIWLLVAMVAATAVTLYFAVVRGLPAYTDGFRIPWWALAAAFAATEIFVIHAHVRGSAHTLSLSELPLVAGLLLATPSQEAAAQHFQPAVMDLGVLWQYLWAESAGSASPVGTGENGWTGRRWSGIQWSGRRWSGRRWSSNDWSDGGP